MTPVASRLRNKWFWFSLAMVALATWTAVWHMQWSRFHGFLHGVPAFFLGVVIEIILFALGRTALGIYRFGWKWLLTRQALSVPVWTVLFLVSVTVLFYTVELWRGKRAWAAVVRDADRFGEPLSLNALTHTSVPAEQNFAQAPFFAPLFSEKVDDSNSPAVERIKNIERFGGWVGDLPIAPWLNQTNINLRDCIEIYFKGEVARATNRVKSAEALLKQLEPFAPALDEVRAASARPYCQWPMQADKPWLIDAPQGRAVRGLMNLLRLRASAGLALGKPEAAFRDVQLALKLAEADWEKPPQKARFVALHGLDLEMLMDLLQPVWEGLAARSWNVEQITKLQRQLETLQVLERYPDAARSDALALSTLIETVVPTSGRRPMPKWGASPEDERILKLFRWFYPVGWSLQDQAAIHHFHFHYTRPSALAVSKREAFRWPTSDRRVWGTSDPAFPVWIVPRLVQMAEDGRELFPFAQTGVDEAMLACALERFWMEQGHYPEVISELAPKYVSKLPADVISGQPLKYIRLADDRFILYSVGLNRADDGAQPSPRSLNWRGRPDRRVQLRKGDWVWLYPVRG